MKIINQVYETTDYDMFVFIESNRDLIVNENLRMSIEESGILVPALVNEKMEVIDGQHRISIAKLCGVKIPFIVVNGLSKKDMIPINNSSKNWTFVNYIETYAKEGFDDYIDLVNLQRYYPVTMKVLVSLAGNTTDGTKHHIKTKLGKFSFYDRDILLDFLDQYKKLNDAMGGKNPSSLPLVIYTMYRNKNFDINRLIDRASLLSRNIKGITGHSKLVEVTMNVYHQNLSNNSKKILQSKLGSKGEYIFTGEKKDAFTKKDVANE